MLSLPLNSNDNSQIFSADKIPSTDGLTDKKLTEYTSFLKELYAHDKDKDDDIKLLEQQTQHNSRNRRSLDAHSTTDDSDGEVTIFPKENAPEAFPVTKSPTENLSADKKSEYASFLSELYAHDKDKHDDIKLLESQSGSTRRKRDEKSASTADDTTDKVTIFPKDESPDAYPSTKSPTADLSSDKRKEYSSFITELYAHDKDKSQEVKELKALSDKTKRDTLRSKRADQIFTELEAPELFPSSKSPLEGLSEDKLKEYDSFIEEIHGREPDFKKRESKSLTPETETKPTILSELFTTGKKNPIEGLSPEKIKEFDDFAEEIHGREPGFSRHTELDRTIFTPKDSSDGATIFKSPTDGLSEDKLREYDAFIEEIHGREPDFKKRQPSKREISLKREKRVITFRPIFVYHQQQVKKERVKVQQQNGNTQKPTIQPSTYNTPNTIPTSNNQNPVFIGANNVILQLYNPYSPYQYGSKYPYTFKTKT